VYADFAGAKICHIHFPKEGLRLIKGFHDESLHGEWKDCRASRLGDKYRVIYKTLRDQILVQVINITAHDYRKK
jgi:addiction module RelE/StbE family toxin